MVLDDIRKTFEAVLGQLTPAKAQQLAKRFQPNAAKEQVSKTAGELVQLSQRLRDAVRKEVASQMRSMGVATQQELNALRARVRDLERAVGAGTRGASARKTAGRAKTTGRASAKGRAKTTGRASTTGRATSGARTVSTPRSSSRTRKPSAAS
jgi:predicted  nucleic acid-binding Zn-ribbon protein